MLNRLGSFSSHVSRDLDRCDGLNRSNGFNMRFSNLCRLFE